MQTRVNGGETEGRREMRCFSGGSVSLSIQLSILTVSTFINEPHQQLQHFK